ncbi:hypothetical protein IP84_00770 [beta proteobacterium AAP99]|nr:hypothetical protein IP84_00770 [beta proteobacterium AAP99]
MADLLPFNFAMPDVVAETQRGADAGRRAVAAIHSACVPDQLNEWAITLLPRLDEGEATRLRAFLRVIQKRIEADLRAHADGGRPPRLAWRRPDGRVVPTNAGRALAAMDDGDLASEGGVGGAAPCRTE